MKKFLPVWFLPLVLAGQTMTFTGTQTTNAVVYMTGTANQATNSGWLFDASGNLVPPNGVSILGLNGLVGAAPVKITSCPATLGIVSEFKLTSINSPTTCALTIPSALATGFSVGNMYELYNMGTGT